MEEQKENVQRVQLPIECDDWDRVKRWGVIPLKEIDDLAIECELPPGWRVITPEGYSPDYSILTDAEGLKRAQVYFKRSFYNRTALMTVVRQRYAVSHTLMEGIDGMQYEVIDAGKLSVVKRFERGQYALKQDEPTQLGFVYRGIFHYDAVKAHGSAFFRRSEPQTTANAELITDKFFYKTFHHVSPCLEVIWAAETVAKADAAELCEELNAKCSW